MAQPQRQANVHQDELCPPNKRYALMDANKKIDLDNPLVRDKYHNLEDDDMVKSIFNSGRNKEGVGMKVPEWMITDEMKLTENYRMTTSAPRSTNPDVDEGESSAPRKSTVIRLRIPPRRSTQLTPPTPIPTTTEAEDIILQDTIQLSIVEQKSRDELEAKPNVENVEEHLIAEEIEKLVEGTENESPEVEKTVEVQLVNVYEEEEESAEDDYELRRREKRKHELTVNDPPPSSSTTSSSSSELSATQRLLSLFKPKTGRFKRYKSFFDELQGRYGYLFRHLKTRFLARTKFKVLALHLQEVMKESLPKMIQADVAKMIADAVQEEHENLQAEITSQINNAITNHIPS
ncbi:hypothetical protein Tco_0001993 [Tanacetum coccineum]